MQILFQPGVSLMRRFRLLPKFLVVSLLFAIPTCLVTGLLIQELNKAIYFVVEEQSGVKTLGRLLELQNSVEEYRAWQNLSFAGNQAAKEKHDKILANIDQHLNEVEALSSLSSMQELRQELGNIKTRWQSLKNAMPQTKARDYYLSLSAYLETLNKLRTKIANEKRLSLDPEVNTYYLIGLFTKTIPEMHGSITEIAARGAPYIDTGLMEANDDVLINVNVLLMQRDLPKLQTQLQSAQTIDPSLASILQQNDKLFSENHAFLERTKNEILNTLNQTSSAAYLENGLSTAKAWQELNQQIGKALASKLEQRHHNLSWNRNSMLFAISIILLLAAYMLISFYLSFSRQVGVLSQAASQISDGDLSHQLEVEGEDELAQLQNKFDRMRIVLAKLVAEIREGTSAIAIASQEIADGNSDLSNRTEQQASSLGETSRSMEELTSTVNQNTQSAHNANQDAIHAANIAKQGGQMVAQLTQMMQGIQASSQKVNDIIAVIDGIAFQTNILALNAAVEAARAGEQGRGFAVVASEVRNLAQRSAAAAKEIKDLITASVEQVKAGSRQVRSTVDTMNQIETSIDSVSANMHRISQASSEQGDGIQMVNVTLNQLDEITQQNAALVEQAAAAANNMHMQAQTLAKSAAVFVIEKDNKSKNAPQAEPLLESRASPSSSSPSHTKRLANHIGQARLSNRAS